MEIVTNKNKTKLTFNVYEIEVGEISYGVEFSDELIVKDFKVETYRSSCKCTVSETEVKENDTVVKYKINSKSLGDNIQELVLNGQDGMSLHLRLKFKVVKHEEL